MVHAVISFLELNEEDDVLDLFCGIGNFSLSAAKFAKSVTGVEGVPLAITCAIQNKKSHQIENVEFQKTSVLSFLKTTNEKYNKIIIDPPRTGVGESLGLVKKLAAESIVYVSCDVRALTNDLKLFKGYEVAKVQAIDMSPQTHHVETVVLLKKSG
ncbi:class I SAM-dependent RNA methyltransferase [Candidatus Woesearchaeota archaeon]|nr:class I SAM-dependent RNA methyltransferase [Candidatus Woesearchaeota archaeon]